MKKKRRAAMIQNEISEIKEYWENVVAEYERKKAEDMAEEKARREEMMKEMRARFRDYFGKDCPIFSVGFNYIEIARP